MITYLNLAEIMVSIVLTVALLMQARSAGLGGIFGGGATPYRTRRGVERSLFKLTIVLAVIFIAISLLTVRAHTS